MKALKLNYLLLVTTVYFLLVPLNLSAKTSLHYVNFTAEELNNIQGHYSTVYGYLHIRVKGKSVNTRYDGKYIQLLKKSDGHFYARYKFLWIFPINIGKMSFTLKKTAKGKIQVVMHENNRHKVVAQKFVATPIPAAWKKRLGIYKATRLKGHSDIKKIRLAIQNGVLVSFSNNLNSPYPLIAKSNTQLVSPSAGHNYDRSIKISIAKQAIILEFDNNKIKLTKSN